MAFTTLKMLSVLLVSGNVASAVCASRFIRNFRSAAKNSNNVTATIAKKATGNHPYPLRMPITNQAPPFTTKNIAPIARLAEAAEPLIAGSSRAVILWSILPNVEVNRLNEGATPAPQES
jgi:hypothetical protein